MVRRRCRRSAYRPANSLAAECQAVGKDRRRAWSSCLYPGHNGGFSHGGRILVRRRHVSDRHPDWYVLVIRFIDLADDGYRSGADVAGGV